MIPPGFKTFRTGDQGDGTYVNPILCADYSDPDVVRVGEDYLTASSRLLGDDSALDGGALRVRNVIEVL
jgi:hypothetical protein